MGCTSSKEPVQHGIITYAVCRGCRSSPVLDESRLCRKCENIKAAGKQVRPREVCPSCGTQTVTFAGEICATCKLFLGSEAWRGEVANMVADVGAVKSERVDKTAVSRLPGTILSNPSSGRYTSRQKQRPSSNSENSNKAKPAPQTFVTDRGYSSHASNFNPSRMSSRLPIRIPDREMHVTGR